MGIPALPAAPVFEGKTSCVIAGRELKWTNCTPAGFAMEVSIATLGRSNPTACSIRHLTGDTSGGTTIPQNAAAILAEYGVHTEVRVGANVCSPAYLATKLRQGCAANIQGNAGALIKAKSLAGVSLRSTGGKVNHNVIATDGRGWHLVGGVYLPTEVRVYDPAADGRHVSWGTAALAPDWWPWAVVLAFCAALQPWGDGDARLLGPGKIYAGIGPDTDPHVHLRYAGSVRTSPFPRAMTAHPLTAGRRVNERSGPSTTYGVVATLASGARFTAYQQNPNGQTLPGYGSLWYGDHDGKRWVHSSGLR